MRKESIKKLFADYDKDRVIFIGGKTGKYADPLSEVEGIESILTAVQMRILQAAEQKKPPVFNREMAAALEPAAVRKMENVLQKAVHVAQEAHDSKSAKSRRRHGVFTAHTWGRA